MEKFIIDTNVYDAILDTNVDLELLKSKGEFYITNVQISEIKNCPNDLRRGKLLDIVEALNQVQVYLESGVWIDDLHWDDNQIWVDGIGESFAALLGNTTNKDNYRDALIGEVAKHNGLTLITNDNDFKKRAIINGIKVMTIANLLSN